MLTRIVSASLVVLGLCLSASASPDDKYKPPELEPSTPWFAILSVVVFVLATAVVGFKKSHRTHLD